MGKGRGEGNRCPFCPPTFTILPPPMVARPEQRWGCRRGTPIIVLGSRLCIRSEDRDGTRYGSDDQVNKDVEEQLKDSRTTKLRLI